MRSARTLNRWWARLRRALWICPRDAQDIRDEVRFHLSQETQLRVDRGQTVEEAARAARRDFGNQQLIQETVRETWTPGALDRAAQDVRYTLRSFRKNPGLVATITLILGIGIGASTVMFSVIHNVLLSPLPYADSERLVYFAIEDREDGMPRRFSWVRLQEMKAVAESFTALGGYLAVSEDVIISGDGPPEALKTARVTANFLDILGVEPLVGRRFREDEDLSPGPSVAMLSARLWRRRFGADPSLAGQTAILDATPYTVVGVLPDGFAFPFPEVDVWTTRPYEPSLLELGPGPRNTLLNGFGRLKPAVTLEQARAELDVLSEAYVLAHPEAGTYGTGPLRITSLQRQLTGDVRSMLWILFGAVVFVLVIACANVASLLMTRAVARAREFGVRTAMGAGRRRLVCQLLTESLVLAVAGGLLGLFLTSLGLNAIASMTSLELPRVGEVQMDGRVLVFAVALTITTGLVFGMFPTLQISGRGVAALFRQGGATCGGASGRTGAAAFRLRGLLVVAQVALSMVLLVGAGLLINSLAELSDVDPGFRSAGLLTMRIPLSTTTYDTAEKRARFFRDLVERVGEIPGVDAAAVTRSLPTTGNALRTNMGIPGQPIPSAQLQSVTPGYLETLGIPLLAGRALTIRDDTPGAPGVAIVNESFARSVWPGYPSGTDPVGFESLTVPIVMRTSGDRRLEIVGVVADVQEVGLTQIPTPVVYVPQRLFPSQTAYLALRSAGDARALMGEVESALRSIDANQPVTDVRMMNEVLGASVGQQRLATWFLGLFAGTAVLLALIGIYGVMSYSVTQSAGEIAIRHALGAPSTDIQKTVMGRGLILTLAGTIVGLGGALALTRIIEGLLFNTSRTDPTIFLGVALLFVVVAMAATSVPAWRAGRVDPMSILRVA